MSDKESALKKYEAEELVRNEVKSALSEYDKALWERIKDHLTIKLGKYESAYTIGKLVATTVLLLFIGTVYQLFVTITQAGVVK